MISTILSFAFVFFLGTLFGIWWQKDTDKEETDKTEILKETLENIDLKFEHENGTVVLTVQSGNYAIKADVTEEVRKALLKKTIHNLKEENNG